MFRWTLYISTALLAASCAHYRVGSAPPGNSGDEEPSVAVETVAVPAEWGIGAGGLTTRLVGELASRGLDAARWSDRTEAATGIHCAADGPPAEAFGLQQAARVTVQCRIVGLAKGAVVVRAEGSAAATAPSRRGAGASGASTAVIERATARALDRAARRIARTYDEAHGRKQSPGDQTTETDED